MQLSNRYTDNIFTLRVSAPLSGSHSVTFDASWDLKTITDGKDYDESNIYTLCVDNDLNTYSNVLNYSADINRYVLNTEIHTAVKNAMPLTFKASSKTTLTQSDVYGMTGRNAFLPDKTFISNGYNNINNGSVDHVYIMPFIYVITKENFEKDYFVARTLGIADSDITRITLQELYEHPDKYYVTHYTQNAIYWFSPSNNNQMGIAFPFRYLYQTEENFSMANYCDLGANNNISTSVPIKTGMGSYYAQSSTGSGGSPFYFSNLQRDIKTNTNNIIPCEITNLDYSPTFDNETKIITGKNDIWKCTSFMGDGYKRSAVVHAFTAEYILKLIASQGLYVSWDNSYVNSTVTLKAHSKLAIGEMNEKGYTTGVIIPPSEKASSNSPNLNYGLFTDSIADPEKYRPTPSSQLDPFIYGGNSIINSSVRLYLAKRSNLSTIFQLILEDAPIGFDFSKNIISLMSIVGKDFFIDPEEHDIDSLIFTATGYDVPGLSGQYMKNSNIVVSGYTERITSQKDIIYVGEINVPRLTNSFLDYEPYSEIELFIPLCGWYKLPSIVVGKKIKINFLIDLANCTIKALVDCDDVTIVEGSGNFGIPMQFTNINVGVMNAARLQAKVATMSSLALGAVGALTGNVALAAGGLTGLANSFTQEVLTNHKNYVVTQGRNGDKTDFGNGEYCYLKITYPKTDIPEDYGKFIGYICNKRMNLSDCHGFTVISDARLETLGTEEEKDELKKLLERGVIFP